MNNETNEEVVSTEDTNNQEGVESTETEETQTEDTTDWQARARELEGRLKRAEKKLSRNDNDSTAKAPSKTGDFDYGQKAFLVANGVKSSDEMSLVKEIMKDTGKNLDQVLESKYFTKELEELREAKKTASAIPTSSKRSNNTSRDSVEYWVAKGELPEDRELRSKVVKAKWKNSSSVNPFA